MGINNIHSTQITTTILLAWIAIHITMGVAGMPGIEDYWNAEYGNQFIRNSQFPRELFEDINVALFHLHEELDVMQTDLNENFRRYWNPFQHNAIDEIMRLFKGHWKLGKCYSPDKPTKWGLKFYAMVDALQYLFWFKLYKRAPLEKNKEPKKKGKEAKAEKKKQQDKEAKSVTRILCNEAISTLPKGKPH